MSISSEPYKNLPPPPFQRPKIELSAAGREWQDIYPHELKENDIVPDIGLVKSVTPTQDPTSVVIVGPVIRKRFNPEVKIWAFTRKPT